MVKEGTWNQTNTFACDKLRIWLQLDLFLVGTKCGTSINFQIVLMSTWKFMLFSCLILFQFHLFQSSKFTHCHQKKGKLALGHCMRHSAWDTFHSKSAHAHKTNLILYLSLPLNGHCRLLFSVVLPVLFSIVRPLTSDDTFISFFSTCSKKKKETNEKVSL